MTTTLSRLIQNTIRNKIFKCTTLLRSNNAIKLTGNEAEALHIIFYMIEYLIKEKFQLRKCLLTVNEVYNHIPMH